MSNKMTGVTILVVLTFMAMIVVNALANILPINGIDTGSVSDFYPNLFAPAGLTFSIWGLIYLLLLGYTLYLLGLFRGQKGSQTDDNLLRRTGLVFSISSLANTAWIFAWHYLNIPLSMVLMIILLGCLIVIRYLIAGQKLTARDKLFIRLPFSVYFGWITVATIANATTLLVSLGWNGFGWPEALWAVIILIIGALIGIVTALRFRDLAYTLVLIWAYIGILIKHTSVFNSQYMAVIVTVIVCLVAFSVTGLYVSLHKREAISQ